MRYHNSGGQVGDKTGLWMLHREHTKRTGNRRGVMYRDQRMKKKRGRRKKTRRR